MRRALFVLLAIVACTTVRASDVAHAQEVRGAIVGWGTQVVGVDLSSGFTAVAAGSRHSVGLKADGSVVPWGDNFLDQCDGPEPNTDFIAIAARYHYSIGLRADGSIAAWGWNASEACAVPEPNTDFIAIAAG